MTHFDFSPLFRTTVGYDRLMRLLEDSSQWTESSTSYPPYNIERTGENRYRVTLAVAGFAEEELSILVHENTLVVEGKKKETEGRVAFLYRGIAKRAFKRQFQVADHVRAVGANLDNGLLTIDLVREVPEELKPRKITITNGAPQATPVDGSKLIEREQAAA
ncbi:MAG: Hsp20 family protein [Rhodospirillales bacterium]|nr:Hsp20 family protein [Rhodospirillales bacterium]